MLTSVQQTRVENHIHEEISQIVDHDEVQFKEQFRFSREEFRVILSNILDINGEVR
jgi:hypothetical protein